MGLTFRHLAPFMDRVPYRHADALAALVGRGRVLLDVGGGTGRVARRLRERFERVVVVDVERNMLQRARERGLAAVVADVRALPFRDGAADAVLMVDAFHHFPDHERVLTEAARVREPHRGRVVIEEFDPRALTGRLVVLFEALARFGSRFHAPEDLRALAERATGAPARVERFNRRDYAVVTGGTTRTRSRMKAKGS